jgi:hypothetical protein
MTEHANDLDRNILALKQLQSVAWRQLADPSLTPFARRELRSEIKRSGDELRYYLEMRSERLRFPARPAQKVASGAATLDLRLLG